MMMVQAVFPGGDIFFQPPVRPEIPGSLKSLTVKQWSNFGHPKTGRVGRTNGTFGGQAFRPIYVGLKIGAVRYHPLWSSGFFWTLLFVERHIKYDPTTTRRRFGACSGAVQHNVFGAGSPGEDKNRLDSTV